MHRDPWLELKGFELERRDTARCKKKKKKIRRGRLGGSENPRSSEKNK